MEQFAVQDLAGSFGVLDSAGLLGELSKTSSLDDFAAELGGVTKTVLEQWVSGSLRPTPILERYLAIYCMRQGLVDLVIRHGGITPSYNLFTEEYGPESDPLGYNVDIKSRLFLRNLPTKIGGFEVSYPLGVPASALTGTHTWIQYHAKRGFDILTYRTVRTVEWKEHKFPHWVFIPNAEVLLDEQDSDQVLTGDRDYWPTNSANVTMANSFGIPSQPPERWQKSVAEAKMALVPGRQILIVSVIGTTPKKSESFEYLLNDFVRAASMAKEAGADIVELNLSCPNLPGHLEENIYLRPDDSREIAKAVWEALGRGSTPLFMKIGYANLDALTELVRATANYIDGIVAINTLSRPVLDGNGQQIFPGRTKAGISGSAIKLKAREVVRNLVEIRTKNSYQFDILAVGGVTTSQDIQDYLNIGANGVQSCTGALMNPDLAIKTRLHTGWIPDPRDKFITVIGNGKNGRGKEVENRISIEHQKPQDNDEIARILTEYDEAVGAILLLGGVGQATMERITQALTDEGMARERVSPAIGELSSIGVVAMTDLGKFSLTATGQKLAKKINHIISTQQG